MKTNYTELEKQIIKKNAMYKSAIDEYHQIETRYPSIPRLLEDYTNHTDEVLIVLYYRTVCYTFSQCQKISDYKNFDDIISTVTCKIAEDVMTASLSKHYSQKVLSYITTVMKSYSNNNNYIESIYDHKEDISSEDILDSVTSKILSENIKKFVETSSLINDRKRKVLEMVIIKDMSYRDIGKEFNVTGDRIGQIYNKALRIIRKKFGIIINDTRYIRKPSNKKMLQSTLSDIKIERKYPKPIQVDGELIYDYIEMMDKPHKVVSDRYMTGDYSGNFNSIYDSIILGRFSLVDFSNNVSLLYNIYRNHILRTEEFEFFFKYYYRYCNYEYIKLSSEEQLAIKATIFHAFYTAVEYSIITGNIYSGYLFYHEAIESYNLEKWFVVSDDYKYLLIDCLAEYVRIYYSYIIHFANRCNSNRQNMLVEYLNKFDYFDQYKKYQNITNNMNSLIYHPIKDFLHHKYISNISCFSEMIQALESGTNIYGDKLDVTAKKALTDECLKNFIINESQAIEFLRK